MDLSPIEERVLTIIGQLQNGEGVHYSQIGDMIGDEVAVPVLTSLELKGLVHFGVGRARLTSLGESILRPQPISLA